MATAPHPFLRDAVFEPEDVRALALAFEDVCRDMDLPVSAALAREVVATRVIDLAREGLIEPMRLKDRVLREVRLVRQLAVDSAAAQPFA